ncbi:hypothetical protein HS088_TW09G00328 [Tripterygium wilfordii]|uniref:Uncharacterized protein n=1 Tax=Tripterygium wilfordii TaxID=458696 RepID=A0A7J7D7I8_TRIWF|nr:hypothetical protein HS088_TW09G00328 [Tripterygium wilfordii]
MEEAMAANACLVRYRASHKRTVRFLSWRKRARRAGGSFEQSRLDSARADRNALRREMESFNNILVAGIEEWKLLKPIISGMNGTWRPQIWLTNPSLCLDVLNAFGGRFYLIVHVV